MLVVFTLLVVFIATFLAAAIAVVVAWMIIHRRSGESGEWPEDVLETQGRALLLKDEALSTVSTMDALLARFDFVNGMKARLAEANVRWSVGRLTALMLLCGSVLLAILTNISWFPGLAGLLVGVAGTFLPYLYVLQLRERRLRRFEEQLPDALDYLSRALKAGHPFAVCLEMLVDESIPPLSVEMRTTLEERNLGLSWDEALKNLARRIPLMDVSFFASAVKLQSRTGGKLGEVLGRLAETIRERFALRGEIRSIATHGRLTGLVLTLIPIVVVGMMMILNPAYIKILTSSPIGKNLIIASIGCLILAHFVIRRIVNIKI